MHRVYCYICRCVVGFARSPDDMTIYVCTECVYSGRYLREKD
jgi:hypothetical protein